MIAGITMLPTDQLRPSPTNPRKIFNEIKLHELAVSIAAYGLLSPIVVREIDPNRQTHESHEIVCGERRWRASCQASVSEVPVIVKDLTDYQVLEIQVIENAQRDDVHPLEECDGFRQILDCGMYGEGMDAIRMLAGKIGMSVSHIYARLQLVKLITWAKDEFLEGAITMGHAVEIARLDEGAQRQVVQHALNKKEYSYEQHKDIWTRRDTAISVRELKRYISDQSRVELSEALFGLDDEELDPEVGPCTRCPFRSGAEAEMLGETVEADECLRPTCFASKCERFHGRRLRMVVEEHPEAVQIFLGYGDKTKLPDRNNYTLCAESDKGAVLAVVAESYDHQKDNVGDLKWVQLKSTPEEREALEAEQKAKELAMNLRVDVEKTFRRSVWRQSITNHGFVLQSEEIRMIALQVLNGLWESVAEKVCRLLGVAKGSSGWSAALKRRIECGTETEVVQALLALTTAKLTEVDSWSIDRVDSQPTKLFALASAAGVDIEGLRAAAEKKHQPKTFVEVLRLSENEPVARSLALDAILVSRHGTAKNLIASKLTSAGPGHYFSVSTYPSGEPLPKGHCVVEHESEEYIFQVAALYKDLNLQTSAGAK